MSPARMLSLTILAAMTIGAAAKEPLSEMEKREAGGQILKQLKARDLGAPLVPPTPADPAGGEGDFAGFDSKEAYCKDLLRQIDTLQGRPLRRKAAQDRFDLDCTPGAGPELINKLPGSRVDPDLN